MQYPATDLTSLSDRVLDSRSSPRAKLHRGLLEGSQIIFSPLLVGRNAWSPITIVKTIYRAASVAMKPSAVSSKGDEVSKRDIFCSKLTVSVSHDLCPFSVRSRTILALTLSSSSGCSISGDVGW